MCGETEEDLLGSHRVARHPPPSLEGSPYQ